MTPAPDPNLGALLAGRYRLLAALGEGGTGTVYDARDERVERPVAVKLLHEHLARRPSHLARFEREALAAGRIGSEHIVAVTDFGQDERGRAFLVMERLKGRDVASAVEEGGPVRDRARPPRGAPVLPCPRGRARVPHPPPRREAVERAPRRPGGRHELREAARLRRGEVPGRRGRDAMTLLTRTGEVIGTPVSMAPEQLDGLELDERADLYALGVVLFYMLAGAYPYEAEDRARLARMIREAPVPSLRARRDDVPEALDALVSRLLAKDRDARPATAGDIGRELAQIAGVA
ncbi:MAG: serine/threonine protein kinase [Sandaracinaceae bacterium]|nr:serine/threonine protein kinase [Sandaracinaceae bacterium]